LAYLGGASFFASCILKGNGEEIQVLFSHQIPLLLTTVKKGISLKIEQTQHEIVLTGTIH
jgi:hypothetical protein